MIVDATDLERLAGDLSGELIVPTDPIYDAARGVWNAMIDRRPAAIARCTTTSDVAVVIDFAVRKEIPLAVRGGGHNVAGTATCDDGLVLDVSPMKSIQVDAEARRAKAGGGVLWGEFDAETQKVGLATTGGLIPSTGIAGFTLGGGLGHLMRSYGLACDNLLSATVVTADGSRVRASSDQNPDLLWALRGGGGNFGVVTEFEFQLHEISPTLLAGRLAHPLTRARDALRLYREFTAAAPDSLIVYGSLSRGPDGDPRMGMRPVFNGRMDEGQSILSPLRKFGPPILDDIQPRSYIDVQKIVEPAFPPGRLNYWKANFIDNLSDELIEILIEAIDRAPSPYSMIALEPMGGAVARVTETATAFEHRRHAYSLLILSGWVSAADTEANVAWARQVWEETRPLSSSAVYVNYLGTEGDERVRQAYGVNHARLARLKRKYDPDNIFRLNQNIAPAPAESDDSDAN